MIYELSTAEIKNVQGTYNYIGSQDNKIYVSGEGLSAPFKESTLPYALEQKMQEQLIDAKVKKTFAINEHCDRLLTSFSSSALGEEYIYDMTLEDQINLMGLALAKIDTFFRCTRKSDKIKDNYEHTAEQIAQVYQDGLTYKAQIIYDCGLLKKHIQACTTLAEVEAISWDSLEQLKQNS